MGCSAALIAKSISGLIQRPPSWSPAWSPLAKTRLSGARRGAGPRPNTARHRRDWRRRLRPPPVLRGGHAAPRHVDLAARKTRGASFRRGLASAESLHRGGAVPRAAGLESRVGYHRLSLAKVRHVPAQSRFWSAPPLAPRTQSDPQSATACSPPQPLAHSFYLLGCLTAALPDGIRFMQQGQ